MSDETMTGKTPSGEHVADENPKPSAFSSPYALPSLEWMLSRGEHQEDDDNGNDPEAMQMARRALHDIAVLYAWSSGGRLSSALLQALLAMKHAVEVADDQAEDEGDDIFPEAQTGAENVESPHEDEAEQEKEKPASAPCFDPLSREAAAAYQVHADRALLKGVEDTRRKLETCRPVELRGTQTLLRTLRLFAEERGLIEEGGADASG